ncbi:hypothetical protein ACIBHY_20025 [Nonomuraea sp. NPDC050547]|uniref:hypothetical protein n=1 Tax=Nonomuraea sp. NPDC050547 TaxID=3364368 RepID=UPI0037B09952
MSGIHPVGIAGRARRFSIEIQTRTGAGISPVMAEHISTNPTNEEIAMAVAYQIALQTQKTIYWRFTRYIAATATIGTIYLYTQASSAFLIGGPIFLLLYTAWRLLKLHSREAQNTTQRLETRALKAQAIHGESPAIYNHRE